LSFAESIFGFYAMAPIAIADIYLFVRTQFGEPEAVSLVPSIGRTKHTIENWLSIIQQFPMERRVDGLEMGHYDAVTGIKHADGLPDVGKQDELLARAGAEHMNISRLRELARLEIEARTPKTIEVEDEDAKDDEKPIFDQGAIGEAQSAERGDNSHNAPDLSDANQTFLNAASAMEKALAPGNVALMNQAKLSVPRIDALIDGLKRLKPVEHRKSVSRPVEIVKKPVLPEVKPTSVSTGEEPEMPAFLQRQKVRAADA